MKHYTHPLRAATIVIVLAIIVLINSAGFSQSPPPPPPPAQNGSSGSTLRVASRLVQVNVIVQEKNGKPVTGLTKSDFTLTDQGQPQTIAFFSEQASHLLVNAGANSAPPPNVYSNRFEEKFGVPTSVTVILLDALNTPRGLMGYARGQVTKFLGQIQPQDRVALYGLADKIYILHDFTSDSTALLRSIGLLPQIDRAQGNASRGMDFAPPPSASGGPDPLWAFAAVQRGADFDQINRVGLTAAAIERIANHLASLPGRKNLIWVSASFPFQIGYGTMGAGGKFEQRSFNSDITKAGRALSNANVAIYPVDARGLMAPAVATGAPISARAPGQSNIETMISLADRTGGRAFYNTNDINGAIRHAIDDSRVTYAISYYPTHNEWDGRFREIRVKLNRPGLEVRTRKGYYAYPELQATPKENETLMVTAAKSPLESTELGLDVTADPIDVPGARELKTQVHVNPAQMHFNHNGDRWADNLVVMWVETSQDGKVIASTSQTVNMNITQEGYDELLRKGLSFSGKVGLVDGASEVRLVARDTGSGAIGSVIIPVSRVFGPQSTQTAPR
jgi:VWFA-related protein